LIEQVRVDMGLNRPMMGWKLFCMD